MKIIYKNRDNDERIRIFGESFVKKNKNNYKINYR